MGYAMSSRNVISGINHELYSLYDQDEYIFSGFGATPTLFKSYYDVSKIASIWLQARGRKSADASTDNYLTLKVDGTTKCQITYNDAVENETTAWSAVGETGYVPIELTLTGGTDSQLMKFIKVVMTRD